MDVSEAAMSHSKDSGKDFNNKEANTPLNPATHAPNPHLKYKENVQSAP